MNPPGTRLLALLALTCVSFALAKTSVAEKVEFPNNDSTFTFELPDKWTFEDAKNDNLNCYPDDDSGYVFSIVILEAVHSRNELKAALTDLAKKLADGAKIKDFMLGKVETSENDNGVSFTGVTGDGKVEGQYFLVVVHGFEIKGKFYAIVTAGSDQADKKHTKNYDAIFDSIRPIE